MNLSTVADSCESRAVFSLALCLQCRFDRDSEAAPGSDGGKDEGASHY